MLLHVAPVLLVRDLDRSIAYYVGRLGFSVDFVYSGSYAAVARNDCRVHLKNAPPIERDQAAFEACEHIDVCFSVSDAAAVAAEFERAGATLAIPLRSSPYGNEVYVKDPDGYILAFVGPL